MRYSLAQPILLIGVCAVLSACTMSVDLRNASPAKSASVPRLSSGGESFSTCQTFPTTPSRSTTGRPDSSAK